VVEPPQPCEGEPGLPGPLCLELEVNGAQLRDAAQALRDRLAALPMQPDPRTWNGCRSKSES
jgi:hypothetical protein